MAYPNWRQLRTAHAAVNHPIPDAAKENDLCHQTNFCDQIDLTILSPQILYVEDT